MQDLNKQINKIIWIRGTCNGRVARKHRIFKNVQFILWKQGEQGHKKDFWVNFDTYWYKFFLQDNK